MVKSLRDSLRSMANSKCYRGIVTKNNRKVTVYFCTDIVVNGARRLFVTQRNGKKTERRVWCWHNKTKLAKDGRASIYSVQSIEPVSTSLYLKHFGGSKTYAKAVAAISLDDTNSSSDSEDTVDDRLISEEFSSDDEHGLVTDEVSSDVTDEVSDTSDTSVQQSSEKSLFIFTKFIENDDNVHMDTNAFVFYGTQQDCDVVMLNEVSACHVQTCTNDALDVHLKLLYKHWLVSCKYETSAQGLMTVHKNARLVVGDVIEFINILTKARATKTPYQRIILRSGFKRHEHIDVYVADKITYLSRSQNDKFVMSPNNLNSYMLDVAFASPEQCNVMFEYIKWHFSTFTKVDNNSIEMFMLQIHRHIRCSTF